MNSGVKDERNKWLWESIRGENSPERQNARVQAKFQSVSRGKPGQIRQLRVHWTASNTMPRLIKGISPGTTQKLTNKLLEKIEVFSAGKVSRPSKSKQYFCMHNRFNQLTSTELVPEGAFFLTLEFSTTREALEERTVERWARVSFWPARTEFIFTVWKPSGARLPEFPNFGSSCSLCEMTLGRWASPIWMQLSEILVSTDVGKTVSLMEYGETGQAPEKPRPASRPQSF